MADYRQSRPVFRASFMGYNKAEVDDYVIRTEHELEIAEVEREKIEHQNEEMVEKVTRAENLMESAQQEKEDTLKRNDTLNEKIWDLEKERKELMDENAKLKKELEDTQRELEEQKRKLAESEYNPDQIKEAILSAQRMGEIVVNEANQKAEEILDNAEKERQMKEEEGLRLVEDAQQNALQITTEAKNKCEGLKQDYDRILLDVSGFKAEMINMYRRHLSLLYTLPGSDSVLETAEGDYLEERKVVEEADFLEESDFNV